MDENVRINLHINTNITHNESVEFLHLFQLMRNFQTQYFEAAKKCAAEKTTENYNNKKEHLARAKAFEMRLDLMAVELLKRR